MRRFLRNTYARRTWGGLAFVTINVPLALFGFAYLYAVVLASALLLITVVGVGVLALGLLGARGIGAAHRWLAGGLLGVPVDPPSGFRPRPGVFGWIRSALADGASWRAVLYLFIKVPVAMVDLAVFLLWVYGLGLLAYPLWFRSARSFADGVEHRGMVLGSLTFDTWPRVIIVGLVGLVVLTLVAPWATRGMAAADLALVRALLGPGRVAQLADRRTQALDDSAAALRRIERDLHDGAQAQLVALAMQLGLAKEELRGGDPAAALELVDNAHENAKQAIVELRDLARGIHPPVLDSGLAPALQTLASRSAVPVELHVVLPERPTPAIETIAYFSAAELLANVAKHSGAQRAWLSLTQSRPGWLRLAVRDNGTGGARPGGGLGGLDDRVRTVDGTLSVDSPTGGPTVVTVELPVRA